MVSSIQTLISFVTMISIMSIPSVGSLSGIQLSILKACNMGEVGLVGRDGIGDINGAMLDVELRARSLRLTVENIA